MELAEELKAKEAELTAQFESIDRDWRKLKTEIAAIRRALSALKRSPRQFKNKNERFSDQILDEAEKMRGTGMTWDEIGIQLKRNPRSLSTYVSARRTRVQS